MKGTDSLSICPRCGSDACYIAEVNQDIKNHFCYGCGFQSNTLMREGEQFLKEQEETLPELYKDLKYEDENGQIWFPSTIHISDKGMVFANGSTSSNWKWAAVQSVEVKEEEKEKYPIPGKKGYFYKNRMDMTTMKMFEENDFIGALTCIGIFPE